VLPIKPPPLVREHRLYQADWLLRFYGFKVDEITTAEAPNLDLAIAPKLSWAGDMRGGAALAGGVRHAGHLVGERLVEGDIICGMIPAAPDTNA